MDINESLQILRRWSEGQKSAASIQELECFGYVQYHAVLQALETLARNIEDNTVVDIAELSIFIVDARASYAKHIDGILFRLIPLATKSPLLTGVFRQAAVANAVIGYVSSAEFCEHDAQITWMSISILLSISDTYVTGLFEKIMELSQRDLISISVLQLPSMEKLSEGGLTPSAACRTTEIIIGTFHNLLQSNVKNELSIERCISVLVRFCSYLSSIGCTNNLPSSPVKLARAATSSSDKAEEPLSEVVGNNDVLNAAGDFLFSDAWIDACLTSAASIIIRCFNKAPCNAAMELPMQECLALIDSPRWQCQYIALAGLRAHSIDPISSPSFLGAMAAEGSVTSVCTTTAGVVNHRYANTGAANVSETVAASISRTGKATRRSSKPDVPVVTGAQPASRGSTDSLVGSSKIIGSDTTSTRTSSSSNKKKVLLLKSDRSQSTTSIVGSQTNSSSNANTNTNVVEATRKASLRLTEALSAGKQTQETPLSTDSTTTTKSAGGVATTTDRASGSDHTVGKEIDTRDTTPASLQQQQITVRPRLVLPPGPAPVELLLPQQTNMKIMVADEICKSGYLRSLVWLLLHEKRCVRLMAAEFLRSLCLSSSSSYHQSTSQRLGDETSRGLPRYHSSSKGSETDTRVTDQDRNKNSSNCSSSSCGSSGSSELWVSLLEQGIVPVLEMISCGFVVSELLLNNEQSSKAGYSGGGSDSKAGHSGGASSASGSDSASDMLPPAAAGDEDEALRVGKHVRILTVESSRSAMLRFPGDIPVRECADMLLKSMIMSLLPLQVVPHLPLDLSSISTEDKENHKEVVVSSGLNAATATSDECGGNTETDTPVVTAAAADMKAGGPSALSSEGQGNNQSPKQRQKQQQKQQQRQLRRNSKSLKESIVSAISTAAISPDEESKTSGSVLDTPTEGNTENQLVAPPPVLVDLSRQQQQQQQQQREAVIEYEEEVVMVSRWNADATRDRGRVLDALAHAGNPVMKSNIFTGILMAASRSKELASLLWTWSPQTHRKHSNTSAPNIAAAAAAVTESISSSLIRQGRSTKSKKPSQQQMKQQPPTTSATSITTDTTRPAKDNKSIRQQRRGSSFSAATTTDAAPLSTGGSNNNSNNSNSFSQIAKSVTDSASDNYRQLNISNSKGLSSLDGAAAGDVGYVIQSFFREELNTMGPKEVQELRMLLSVSIQCLSESSTIMQRWRAADEHREISSQVSMQARKEEKNNTSSSSSGSIKAHGSGGVSAGEQKVSSDGNNAPSANTEGQGKGKGKKLGAGPTVLVDYDGLLVKMACPLPAVVEPHSHELADVLHRCTEAQRLREVEGNAKRGRPSESSNRNGHAKDKGVNSIRSNNGTGNHFVDAGAQRRNSSGSVGSGIRLISASENVPENSSNGSLRSSFSDIIKANADDSVTKDTGNGLMYAIGEDGLQYPKLLGSYAVWQEVFSHTVDAYLLESFVGEMSNEGLAEAFMISRKYNMATLTSRYARALLSRLSSSTSLMVFECALGKWRVHRIGLPATSPISSIHTSTSTTDNNNGTALLSGPTTATATSIAAITAIKMTAYPIYLPLCRKMLEYYFTNLDRILTKKDIYESLINLLQECLGRLFFASNQIDVMLPR